MREDYRARFGFGVEVDEETFKGIEDRDEYLDNILINTDYRFLKYGDSYYNEETICIILRKTLFDVDYNVNNEVKEFETYLKSKGIKFKGKTNVVGGLHIY